MNHIEVDEGIKEYYKEVKDKYPDISFEEFQAICKHPFYFFRSKMGLSSLPVIYVKYFGKFKVYAGRIKTLLKELDTRLFLNKMSPERHSEIKTYLQAKLKIIEENELLKRDRKDDRRKKKLD